MKNLFGRSVWGWCFGMCCLLWSVEALQAQKREDLYDQVQELGAFKRLNLSYDFKAGERILLNVEVIGRRKLKWVIVEEPGSEMKHTAKRTYGFERKSIVVQKEGAHNFSFINRGLLKRSVRIRIQKETPYELTDTLFLEDVMVSSSLDSMPEPYIDTIPFPDITQQSFLLSPTLDYLGKKDSCISEMLLEDTYQFAVYWIGIGDKPLAEYEALKQNPPPNWVLKGINEPLLAYGMGLTKQLPESTTPLARRVGAKFTNPNNDKGEVKTSERIAFYGFIPMEKAMKYKKIMMCIRNFNANSPVNIHVKIAKFKVDKGERQKYLIRERIQEVYVKEKILKEEE